MRNIRLTISYDGTDFMGWQVQAKGRSVQGVLEDALEDLHGEQVTLIGAGRTDAGVHATGQVANFYSAKSGIPDWRFRDALNTRLPRDLRVLESREVSENFHSRRDALTRVYEYHILEGAAAPAHLARYCWLVKRLPPLALLDDLAAALVGTRDFSSFAAAGDESFSKVREIKHAVFLREGRIVVFRVAGNAFLWRMVRTLLGTVMKLGLDASGPEEVLAVLERGDRNAAGPTAPPRGLFLRKVLYGQDTGVR